MYVWRNRGSSWKATLFVLDEKRKNRWIKVRAIYIISTTSMTETSPNTKQSIEKEFNSFAFAGKQINK